MRTHAQLRTDADATAAASTLEDDVARALHDLPSAELEVLRGRFGIGARRRSRREIARRLGLGLRSVRRLERLALRDLRALALPSDVPRRRPLPGALTVGRSGEVNRPAPPGQSRPPLPRPLSPERQTPRAAGLRRRSRVNVFIFVLALCPLLACGWRPSLRLPPQVAGQIPAGYELGQGRGVVVARFRVTTQGEPGFGAISNPLVVELREQHGGEPSDENPQGLTLPNDSARVFTSPRTVPTLWRYHDPGLMVASFKPGTYDGLVIAYPDVEHPALPDSIPAPSQGLRFQPIEVPADTIVYIGDIQLRQDYGFWDRALDRVNVEYAVSDEFEQTIADFRARYPQFAGTPVEKKLASAVTTAE